jgi:hypothetical protein
MSSNAPLSGIPVTVAAVPNAATCLASQKALLDPCVTPTTAVAATTTTANGSFSLANIKNGTYYLTIGKPVAFTVAGNYATLHRTIALGGGVNALGSVHLTSIPWPSPVWLETLNNSRTQVYPISYGNLVVDEYAQEQAVAAVAAMTKAKTLATDFSTFGAAYAAAPGSLYQALGFGYLGNPKNNGDDGPEDVNNVVFADKSYCNTPNTNTPATNWTNCPTTHEDYPIAASTRDVWVGLGSPAAFGDGGAPYFYSLVIVTNQSGTMPQ